MNNKDAYLRIIDTIENITRIDFCIFSNSDIKKGSAIQNIEAGEVIGINVAEIFNNNEPVENGVLDKRLGVIETKSVCETCGEKALKCPGHFGHIKFVEPVFHMGFLPYIKNILSCICIRCNKLLVHKNEQQISKLLKNKYNKKRFQEIRNIVKGITHCQGENYGCGAPVHKISIEKKYGKVLLLADAIKKTEEQETPENKKRTPQYLSPQLCYDILKAISDEDCIIMGFDPKKSRPEDMIIVNFPVPPVQVRPSVKVESLPTPTQDDDLTHKLLDIVKSNENLKDSMADGSLIKTATFNDDAMFLQLHVATFFANDILGMPRSQQKNKKETKSLSDRLKGKEGRVRGNLMGKRVDMSARTVITSDPYISLNEVGIPLIIAKNLTYPEIVTKKNINYLTKLVNNKRKIYPGANYVIKNSINRRDGDDDDGVKFYNLAYAKKISLSIGDIVERHLVNGDIVLFNRQPSLHKLSMMAHKVHVINNPSLLTFRMNVNVTDPYNADFDGDEMNIHIPQSSQTDAELRLIANVIKRFVSPATSKIAINAKQDTLMGSYLETYETTKIDWKDAMNILMTTSIKINNNIPKNKLISGKKLYSEIIPKTLNIINKKDGNIVTNINNGKILVGNFGKSEISSIIQKLWFNYGSNVTQQFIDDLQRMILNFLMSYGFTIGIKDTIMSSNIYDSVYKIIETKRKEALTSITQYENDPYVMTFEAFEITLQKTLSAIQHDVQTLIMNNFKKDNGIYMAISSGSSGTDINAGQIIGFIGQVIVEGKRIQKKFNNRTLPMFFQHDDSPFARGFCTNSFISGLNPMEFFFQVMAGREGIINTAIVTADTGYVQRKLVKILEDIKVEYDGTVRNANDKIIQCVSGDNGISTEKQVEQKIFLISSSNKIIQEQYIYSKEEIEEINKKYNFSQKYTQEINNALYNKLIIMRNKIRKLMKYIDISNYKETYMLPVDLNYFILSITNRENRNKNNIVDPIYVLKNIKEMYTGKESRILKFKDNYVIKKKDEKKIKFILKLYLYDVLTPKKCTHNYKLSLEEFNEIVNYFKKNIQLAKIESGEMVGFVSSQSIGEPVTQSNLKSFQKSGLGKTVTGGLIRVKELLSITRNIKTPITKIIMNEKYKTDKVIVSIIASNLKFTTLRDIIEKVDIYYDPNPNDKNSIMNQDQVKNIFEIKNNKIGCQEDINNLPWLLRLTLSKEKMIERNITMLEIKTSFCQNWISSFEDSKNSKKEYRKIIEKITKCSIITNYDNSPIPLVHIRFDAKNYNFNTLIQFQEIVIDKYRIKGLSNIIESKDIFEESYIDFDENDNRVEKKQYYIMTDGINLSDMSQINGINLEETFCNDIVTIYETYGVEAARTAFIREFTLSFQSSGFLSNYQHIELLADAITHMGGLIPVNRHGANKLDTDPFSRASFEKTVEQLLAAAVFGESDHIRSVSAKIMVGSLINGGTGCFDLLLDHLKIKKYLIKKEDTITTTNIIKKKTTDIDNLIKKKNKKD